MAEVSDHEQLLRTFFARWAVSFEELCQSMRDTMAEDCLFQQTRLPDLVGPRATIAFLKEARASFGFETFAVRVGTVIAQRALVWHRHSLFRLTDRPLRLSTDFAKY